MQAWWAKETSLKNIKNLTVQKLLTGSVKCIYCEKRYINKLQLNLVINRLTVILNAYLWLTSIKQYKKSTLNVWYRFTSDYNPSRCSTLLLKEIGMLAARITHNLLHNSITCSLRWEGCYCESRNLWNASNWTRCVIKKHTGNINTSTYFL